MSEENKTIARRWMEELWSQGNSDVADEIIAANYAVHDPGTPGRVGGVEGEKHTVTMYRTVFPDLRFTMEDVVGEGDRVVVRWTTRGTHRGELMGVPPTGKQVVVTGISILRIANGKIAEHKLNWDTLGMLQQLGIVPPTGEDRALSR
jgi:steroid delta-isomerase-like uncharacterized protein